MNNNKKNKIILGVVLVILIVVAITVAYNISYSKKLINRGYFPLKETMKASGFEIKNDNSFEKINAGKEIVISFDFENKICKKNQYTFSLENYEEYRKEYYIEKELLESILNGSLSFENGHVTFNQVTYEAHEWLNYPKLIAHGGGGAREKSSVSYYTNSLEALIQNYNLGHRVFEFDFYLTSDYNLAAVHDWDNFGYCDGTWLSAKEWENFEFYGIGTKYTTMMISDVLDEMLVNKDMFLVTDTKSTEFTEKQTEIQFHIIYYEAMKRDPELLDRIIPQIYNEKMYDIIKSVYDFKSIIYTAYATSDSAQQIISFANQKDEIKVITAPIKDQRFNEEAIKSLHTKGLLIFAHTINLYSELAEGLERGIDGFYTDLLLQSDLEIYNKVVEMWDSMLSKNEE